MVITAAAADPGAVALLAPGREDLSHRELVDLVHQTAGRLRSHGIGRRHRVGVVMPDGPETVVLQLAVMSAAVCAPLNPAFNEQEFDFFLRDLQVSAVIVPWNTPSAARAAARQLGLVTLEARVNPAAPAGSVELSGPFRGAPVPAPASGPGPGDLAVLMHTAGTTSRAKIVALTHNNFYAAVRNVAATLRLGPADRCLSVMPQFHISGLCSWMYALGSGGSVVCAPAFLAPKFFEWMNQFQPTWYNVAPTLHQAILERAPQNLDIIKKNRLRFMRSAAAPMPPEVIRSLEQTLRAPFIESYGMTEAGSQIASNPMPPGRRKPGSVGVGVGTEIAVLDDEGNQAPQGGAGEVVVRGPNVFSGYENNPEANAEAFINGWLRTGDRGYFDSDGYLFLTGRIKELINRGGEKISAREVEEVLLQHPAVSQAAVFPVPDPRLGEEVAAAVVRRAGVECGEAALRDYLAARLVHFKVPSQVVFLADLPKNASGKVARLGLAKKLGVVSKSREPAGGRPWVAPRTAIEISLAAIWRKNLGVEKIGLHDPFLDLGGDSVQAGQIIAQIRSEFGVETPVLRFFEAATISALAELLPTLPQIASGGAGPAGKIARAPESGAHPLTEAQRRLFFLHAFEEDDSQYHISFGLKLRGPLDEPALVKSLDTILARHDVLRAACFLLEGKPTQRVAPSARIPFARRDFSSFPPEARRAEWTGWMTGQMNRPFNLGSGPMIRAALGRFDQQEHALVITLHHIACDNWSLGVLAGELEESYRAYSQGATPEGPPALPIQYQDYAVWLHHRPEADHGRRSLDYWRRQLEGLPEMVEFPGDRPRPPVLTNAGARLVFSTPPGLGARLRELARREGVTPFVLWLAGFQTLLHRRSGQNDIPVGSTVANRSCPELEGLIGLFVNTLVLRVDFGGNPSFRELLGRAKRAALEAFDHQDTPFEALVETLNPPRSRSHGPFFQAALILLNAPSRPWRLPGLEVDSFRPDPGRSTYDVALYLTGHGEEFGGWFEYNTSLYDESTIERLSTELVTLMEAASKEPGLPVAKLPLMRAADTRQILVDWNNTAVEYPRDKLLHELFEEQAGRTPGAVAVGFAGQTLTYRQLDEKSTQLARHLRGLGVGPDCLAGICAERSPDLVVGLLAILKAGGAYVPFDPEYPKDRLAFMLEDSGVGVLLVPNHLAGLFPPGPARLVRLDAPWPATEGQDSAPAANRASPTDAAYMIYTSGSTGRPKGAVNTHQGIVNRLLWMQDTYRLRPSDCVLQKTPFSFDVSVWEFFWPLLAGARLVLAKPGGHRDPVYLARLIAAEGITTLHFVPSMLQAFLDQKDPGPACGSLRLVICSGEAIPADLVRRFYATLPGELHNLYGPTEASVDVTFWACPREGCEGPAPIGRPIANTRVYILDHHLQPVPVGIPGELHIAGVGLARGYHRLPELTAEKFIPDPFSAEPGARLYKSGDLARYRNDGVIEYVGRIDHQVKIRGVRVEPGEIEFRLRQHPAVKEALVLAREDSPGGLRLVAHIVPTPSEPAPSAGELRDFLRQRLPDAMVPSAFVSLEKLPLTPNGKVDRKALPAPDSGGSGFHPGNSPPRNPVEQCILEVWREVLNARNAGIQDNFFDLGGHSLTAMQVVARLRGLLDTEIPLSVLFESPTVAGLAGRIAALQGAASSEIPPLTRTEPGPNPPLSFAQERLWFLNRFEKTGAVYNTPSAWLLRGVLDGAALRRALNAMVERHETLRTRFAESEAGPIQIVEPAVAIPLPVEDLGRLEGAERDEAVKAAWLRELGEPFDLAKSPLVRARLLAMGEREHLLLLMCSHINSDAWSQDVFNRELAAFYNAFKQDRKPNLPELPVQYLHYAVWQRNWLRDTALDRQVDYWRRQLSGAPVLDLPADRKRPARQTYAGARHLFVLPDGLSAKMAALGRTRNATPFMILLGAFHVLLARYSGQRDILVGTPMANRQRPELENLVGIFVNTLVMRLDLSGDPTFGDVIARIRQTAIEAYQHQDLPFEKLVEALNPPRDLGRHPLFQVMFGMLNAPSALWLDGLEVSRPVLPRITTRFDLELQLQADGAAWTGYIYYNTDLFDADSIVRLAGHYLTLLESMLAEPERPVWNANLLTPGERAQILVDWNKTAVEYPRDKLLHELFEEQAARTPEAVALAFEGQTLTYRRLNEKSSELARHLRGLGVGPDCLAGICAERSPDLVAGLLAILKAGGAYVPLDPEYPKDRLAFMLEDSGVGVLLLQNHLAGLIPPGGARLVPLDAPWPATEGPDSAPAANRASPTDAAYMIYTSGSTGRPKGAVNTHQGIVNRLLWMQDTYRLTPSDCVLQKTPFSFDVSVWEFFWPLLAGARLVLAKPGGHRDPVYLKRLIAAEGVTTVHFVPSMLQAFLDQKDPGPACASLRRVICSGEALSAGLARKFYAVLPGELHNLYGPTEASVDVTSWACPRDGQDGPTPIGRPIANTRIYILDRHLQPVPAGVPGELHIAGVGLARGYHRRPELTAEKFIPDPFSAGPGARLYKTGDLARYRKDGVIEYLGRLDHQVKIRGFRIELGEIEAILNADPNVREAVVVVREDHPGDPRMAAYVVPAGDSSLPDIASLRDRLRKMVPDHMVPAAFVPLERLPLTPSGKVDRRTLPAPGESLTDRDSARVEPRDNEERQLAAIWTKLLGTRGMGVHDNFFDLGGHSLMTLRLQSMIENTFGVTIPMEAVFEYPTIARLAEIVRGAGPSGGTARMPGTQVVEIIPPLFFLHFQTIARRLEIHLGKERKVLGVGARADEELSLFLKTGRLALSIQDLAARDIEIIRRTQPSGPYHLIGYCFGGVVAFEVACQLKRRGEQIASLTLIDAVYRPGCALRRFARLRKWIERPAYLLTRDPSYLAGRLRQRINLARRRISDPGPSPEPNHLLARFQQAWREDDETERFHDRMLQDYQGSSYEGPTLVFRAVARDFSRGRDPGRAYGWDKVVVNGLRVENLRCNHAEIYNEPYVGEIAKILKDHLSRHDPKENRPPQPA